MNTLLAMFLPAFALRWLRRHRDNKAKMRLAIRGDFKFHDTLSKGD